MFPAIAGALRRNPYPLYSLLRRTRPVLRIPGRDVWLVLDHASVKQALLDPATFSSRAAPPGGTPLDWLIFTDAPRHTRLRALISRTFTPRAVQALEDPIARIAHRLLDDVSARGRMDFVAGFSEPLPVLVIMALLGIPEGEAPRVLRWADAILHLGDTIVGGERAARALRRYREAVSEMRPLLDALLAERRDAARDDLLSRLVHAEFDGSRLDDEEIFSFFQLLLLAGTETTTNLLANSIVCLLEHPHQLELLRQDAALLSSAVEEVLRYRSPVQMVFRRTTCDVVVRNRTIPADRLVLLMVGSANRDPGHFTDPDTFDISRAGTPHVGFGHGAHYCLGAALARVEARVALGAFLARVGDFGYALGKRWHARDALNVHGPRTLLLRFTPAASPPAPPRRSPPPAPAT